MLFKRSEVVLPNVLVWAPPASPFAGPGIDSQQMQPPRQIRWAKINLTHSYRLSLLDYSKNRLTMLVSAKLQTLNTKPALPFTTQRFFLDVLEFCVGFLLLAWGTSISLSRLPSSWSDIWRVAGWFDGCFLTIDKALATDTPCSLLTSRTLTQKSSLIV